MNYFCLKNIQFFSWVLYIVLTETLCLGEKLPICKAQGILKPECTTVHEDFRILQQRRRWVSFRSNTNYSGS